MKKNILYTILLVLFAGTAGFILLKYNGNKTAKENTVYTLIERTGDLAKQPEWIKTKTESARLMKKLSVKPGDNKTLVELANLFIQEARATGNYSYYDAAALKYVNDVLKKDSSNFEALTLKALVQMSQHHFSDGLNTAQRAVKMYPLNAFVQGVLVDGYVETGNYDSAVASAERMMSIRPDLRSYSRASYLREIYGDYPGAIEAMQLAIQAGAPGDEATEWSRVQLGHLYENTGDFKKAEMQYSIALENRPGYVHALAGMARISIAAKKNNDAIRYYEAADAAGNDISFKEELAEAYNLSGQHEKATAIRKALTGDMNKKAMAAAKDENIGHYADKELAYAYLSVDDYDKALEHALLEYNRRPGNIEVNETLAWVYYKKGDYAKAVPYINTALKTNSKSPVLLSRAGMVYAKAGEKEKARQFFTEAFKNNPNIAEALKKESISVMSQL